jgi:hypothetical protein
MRYAGNRQSASDARATSPLQDYAGRPQKTATVASTNITDRQVRDCLVRIRKPAQSHSSTQRTTPARGHLRTLAQAAALPLLAA